MNLVVYDKTFTPVGVTDIYESIIWTERYYECGDFEIYTMASKKLIQLLKEDYYLRSSESEYTMVIEHVKIEEDVENGDKLIVSGRSLESILDRRIVWDNIKVSGTLVSGLQQVFDANIINPKKKDEHGNIIDFTQRKIPNFVFDTPTDESILSAQLIASYYGSTVLEVVQSTCQQLGLGFRMVFIPSNKSLHFQLFNGLNLSADKTKNPNHKVVIFSPEFDNLISSNYELNRESYKNVTLVGGIVNESAVQKRVEVEGRIPNSLGEMTDIPVGLDRREVYTDATSLSNKDEQNQEISDADYNERLANEGYGALNEFDYGETIDASVEPNYNWKYGNTASDDYYLGDIVTISNAYGMSIMARVIEVVRSHDTSGNTVIPSFTTELFNTEGTAVTSVYSAPGGGTGGSGGSATFKQEQADWAVNDPNSVSYIRNKPDDLPDIGGYYVPGTNSTPGSSAKPYYAARWRGTHSKITSLYTGLMILYKNDVAGFATYGVVLDINNLGEHPVVRNADTGVSTSYPVGSIINLVYDADQVATVYRGNGAEEVTGCWKIADYNSDSDTTYLLRQYNGNRKLNPNAGQLARYQFCMTDMNGDLIPFNNVSNKATTYTKELNDEPFNPFGPIFLYYTTTIIAAGGNVAAANLYQQRGYSVQYSLNILSGGNPGVTGLVSNEPVYIRALYNKSTHLATFVQDISSTSYLERSSIVQSLPSAEESAPDGYIYIYIYFGHAYSTYQMEMPAFHPVYYWNKLSNSIDVLHGQADGLKLMAVSNSDGADTYTALFYN